MTSQHEGALRIAHRPTDNEAQAYGGCALLLAGFAALGLLSIAGEALAGGDVSVPAALFGALLCGVPALVLANAATQRGVIRVGEGRLEHRQRTLLRRRVRRAPLREASAVVLEGIRGRRHVAARVLVEASSGPVEVLLWYHQDEARALAEVLADFLGVPITSRGEWPDR